MATKSVYYIVTESLIGDLDGASVELHKGEVVEADDPAVRKWPHHFAPFVPRRSQPMIEQATAAPGEKRG